QTSSLGWTSWVNPSRADRAQLSWRNSSIVGLQSGPKPQLQVIDEEPKRSPSDLERSRARRERAEAQALGEEASPLLLGRPPSVREGLGGRVRLQATNFDREMVHEESVQMRPRARRGVFRLPLDAFDQELG